MKFQWRHLLFRRRFNLCGWYSLAQLRLKKNCVKCGGPWSKELFGEGTHLEGWCMRCYDWTWQRRADWVLAYGEPDQWMKDREGVAASVLKQIGVVAGE